MGAESLSCACVVTALQEFLNGIRLMCDESGGTPWKKKRVECALLASWPL
jgi:hypothetical protein